MLHCPCLPASATPGHGLEWDRPDPQPQATVFIPPQGASRPPAELISSLGELGNLPGTQHLATSRPPRLGDALTRPGLAWLSPCLKAQRRGAIKICSRENSHVTPVHQRGSGEGEEGGSMSRGDGGEVGGAREEGGLYCHLQFLCSASWGFCLFQGKMDHSYIPTNKQVHFKVPQSPQF